MQPSKQLTDDRQYAVYFSRRLGGGDSTSLDYRAAHLVRRMFKPTLQ